MGSNLTRFSDAVYHRRELHDLGVTEFTRRELKILLHIDGKRTISDIAEYLTKDSYSLMPAVARLVKLGLIQTEDSIVSAEADGLMYDSSEPPPVEYTLSRLPVAI